MLKVGWTFSENKRCYKKTNKKDNGLNAEYEGWLMGDSWASKRHLMEHDAEKWQMSF